ncbi:MAG: hypothetical protein ABL994_18000 [Verrucomicrobiales bacterium]
MCNSYRIGRPKPDDLRGLFLDEVAAFVADWEKPRLIRPTVQAPVVLPGGEAKRC